MLSPPELERRQIKFCLPPSRPSTMQGDSHYYGPPCQDDEVLRTWLRSNRMTRTPSVISTFLSLSDDEKFLSPALEIALDKSTHPLSSDWASTTTCGDPFASQSSMASASDIIELPEIPFIASPSTSSIAEEDEESVWPDLMHRTPSSSSSDRQEAVLGQTPPRILSHSRQRSGSISSTASRPAPARSILSSSSSIKTRRGRSAPSVKFLDMPIIHYEDEDDEDSHISQHTWPSGPPGSIHSRSTSAPSANPAVTGKQRVLGILTWLMNPRKQKVAHATERPSISGPFPLWEAPLRSDASIRRGSSPTGARSIRSVRSTSSFRSTRSMRSIRSCASRVQEYWSRLSGRDS